MSNHMGIIAIIVISTCGLMPAQTENQTMPSTGEKSRFEVISIKQAPYDKHMASCDFQPGGRLQAHNSLRGLIAHAYEVSYLRILGMPDSFEKIFWDIEARPEEGKYALKDGLLERHLGNLMIQSMLEDRFKLKTHLETRIMPGYELTIAKGGPKLKKPEIVQAILKAGNGKGGRAIFENGDGAIGVYNAGVSGLAYALEMTLHRTVVDKTGIEGNYDMKIAWTPEKGRSSVAGSGQTTSVDPEITIFEAIQEQLGLKLTPAKVPTQFLVVDDVQMPKIN
jgi:uncharacterized protein (TIGR03435 family)